MISTASIHIRPDDTGSLPLVREIVAHLRGRRVSVLLPDTGPFDEAPLAEFRAGVERLIKESELIIVIGGDGTFLRTARLFAGTSAPLFGINRGRMGFLTEFSPAEAIEHLDRALVGERDISKRSTLKASLVRDGRELYGVTVINDAVISKGAISRPISVRLELDGSFLNCYSGDGLIISTPTGSTAYSLSAGGPIVIPDIDNAYILSPICPHMLAVRPMLIPAGITLSAKVVSDFENLLLTIDGQEAIPIEAEDEVRVRGSEKKIHLIRHPSRDYYEILRRKLGWGKNTNGDTQHAD
ncbi:MAG TPA: NAD(+)/NADH kinase [Spirochaetota bacterium]|nr:NAD(+)/NADH kinase [Spirochaetota bacterium]HPV97506.1 NAD(+)/NADH kinase [Spirochaetota bacterium]